ncbi:hemerythrin domain-containing protein [Roseomonas sp. SSH11]|uniref:Hemerythrin domain-containing protein n=1 Tax=Pararoseomonas baculiformis TaxID=2820812 RepID=A0ABS4ALI0_9PROT|nr:hemerythrin domain-containing protein [Pararoseomonas baculiformis]MBP0447876.1 hemerythrin domain-containing protein [Pararoseomonas baculiformis]
MSLRTLMQEGSSKVNDLFARLSDTTEGAVKTREKLFGELKGALELHANLEEEFLFPLLRKNSETRGLVVEAIADNKNLRAKLTELDTLPKNDEAFIPLLAELQKAFRQHARDEKKELLPAVQSALSAEQVQKVTEKMEASLAEVEQARQEEAEERRAKARREREQAELEAEAADRQQQEREAAERRSRETASRVANAAAMPLDVAAEATGKVARLVTSSLRAEEQATPVRAPAPTRPSASAFTDMFLWPWAGAMQGLQQGRQTGPSGTRAPTSQEEVIPLGEEVLEVTKRTENRGTARVRRYVVETEVEEQVTLQSERVVVERRRPVSDKITGEILTEVTVEVVETAEV